MKENKVNKSVSTSTNKLIQSITKDRYSANKKSLSSPKTTFLNLNDIFTPYYNNKNINNRYYYKNPQFFNSSSIKSQIDFLLTNIKNNPNYLTIKNSSSTTLKKLPKLKTLKNEKTNSQLPSPRDIEEKIFPNISITPSNNYNIKFINNNNISNDVEQKEEYMYKNIFSKSPLFKPRPRFIDNKLNLIYCENEKQYKIIMERRNKQMKEKGTILKFQEDSEKIKNRVTDIKSKIKFMKSVMDFSYPGLMISKIKSWGKEFQNQNHNNEKLTPFEEQKMQIKRKNILRTNYLKQNMQVFPITSYNYFNRLSNK